MSRMRLSAVEAPASLDPTMPTPIEENCTGFEVRGPELGMAGHFLRVVSAAIIDEPDGFPTADLTAAPQ